MTIRQKCYLGQLTQVNLVLGRYVHSNEQHKNVPQAFLEAQRIAINFCVWGLRLWGGCLYGVLGVGIHEFVFCPDNRQKSSCRAIMTERNVGNL